MIGALEVSLAECATNIHIQMEMVHGMCGNYNCIISVNVRELTELITKHDTTFHCVSVDSDGQLVYNRIGLLIILLIRITALSFQRLSEAMDSKQNL